MTAPCPYVAEGAELRELRCAAGITLTALAKATGWSLGYLSNVERGYQPATAAIKGWYEAMR